MTEMRLSMDGSPYPWTLNTIGGSACDGTDARPRPILPIIHGIALHAWIAIVPGWRATYLCLIRIITTLVVRIPDTN